MYLFNPGFDLLTLPQTVHVLLWGRGGNESLLIFLKSYYEIWHGRIRICTYIHTYIHVCVCNENFNNNHFGFTENLDVLKNDNVNTDATKL